jgi:polysaccharide pyruvyl transferase WcaK-like protein
LRITVTGGWGYGNLGDDAILAATIKNLENVFPNCKINIFTYDISDSAIHAREHIHLHKSLHAYVDFCSSEGSYKKLGKDYSLYSKIFLKIKSHFVNSPLWSNIANISRFEGKIKKVIAGSRLFVVAGGGYLNENWMSSTIAHLVEMKMAIELGVPFCVAGPTIGTFSNHKVKDVIFQTLRRAASIYVRDSFSFQQLQEEQIATKNIPDIALSNWRMDVTGDARYPGELVVGVIINNRDQRLQGNLCRALSTLLFKFEGRVKIIMSRRWKHDFWASLAFQKRLGELGHRSEIIVPESHESIEKELMCCNVVISENLHGLILAARNLISVVAINDYCEGTPNYNKIHSFLEQNGSESFVLNRKKNHQDIRIIIEKAYLDKDEYSKRAMALREQVRCETERFFQELACYCV